MYWKRKESEPAVMYERLAEAGDKEGRVPKGHVPVLVGTEGSVERFLVPLRLFNDPRMASLLDVAAQEFGYQQEGILRVLCDVDHFRRVVEVISKSSR